MSAIWEVLTFQGSYGRVDVTDIVLGILLWIMVLAILVLVGGCVSWLIYTIYRVIAYDYEMETLRAEITDKEYEPESTALRYNAALKMATPVTKDAKYNVSFVTENGLTDTIDDEELYGWASEGSKFKVTMKIGRNRNGEIKYWRTTHYSFH